jgi:hypothetical protein
MSGDYSRKTFDRAKHYSGVLMQQGRVQLDSDANEQLAIQHYRDETEAIDVIGQSGVPKKNDGFKIGTTPDGLDLTIKAGRYYVGGLLCELETASTYLNQPHFPKPEFTTLIDPPTDPPGGRELDLDDGTYLVYLDAWQREITALDDKLLREVALGGPDTTTRIQNVWQVRLLRVGDVASPNTPPENAITCKTPFAAFDELAPFSTGKLNARTQPPQPETSACLLPPGTGYNRLENQLYRVEVHTGGSLNQTTFKWSRDNASVESKITKIVDAVVTVSDLGKDEMLSFASGQWVEIVDDESTLKGEPHPLVQIDEIGPGPNEITLTASADAFANGPGLKLRRWDQTGINADADGFSANLSTWIELEGGIQVSFSAGNYRAGDYWLIPARTATGEIEWPPYKIPNVSPEAQSPRGIRHHYCRLALIESQGNALTFVADCRKPFPALTEICAVDVCFDNTTCDFDGAKTVQDALDALCRKREGACTFIAVPGNNLQQIFDLIPEGGDAEICFQVGTFELPATVDIKNKGHLKLSGRGPGTRLIAKGAEMALRFESCKSVTVRDIYGETGIITSVAEPRQGLTGTLTFLNCARVNVESVSLQCGEGAKRSATCITVLQSLGNDGLARIVNCDLSVGHQQGGILIVNASRSHVEDNVIRVYNKHAALTAPDRFKNKDERANIRGLLIADANLDARDTKGKTNVKLTSGDHVIQFRTNSKLKKAWPTLLKKNPPKTIDSPKALLAHVSKLADRLLLESAFRKTTRAFATLLDPVVVSNVASAAQGITIGGDQAGDVRVVNNTIVGVAQGIHVGVSRQKELASAHIADVVTISGNTISVVLTADTSKRDRHGIFVGNCDSLLIEKNNIRLSRVPATEQLEIDGIRVWGQLGDRIHVTQNHLRGDRRADTDLSIFDTGIRVHPNSQRPAGALWLVDQNVAPARQTPVRAENGTTSTGNFP